MRPTDSAYLILKTQIVRADLSDLTQLFELTGFEGDPRSSFECPCARPQDVAFELGSGGNKVDRRQRENFVERESDELRGSVNPRRDCCSCDRAFPLPFTEQDVTLNPFLIGLLHSVEAVCRPAIPANDGLVSITSGADVPVDSGLTGHLFFPPTT